MSESLRNKVIREIISTEDTYLHQLYTLDKFFVKPCQEQKLLPTNVQGTVFGELPTLRHMNEQLRSSLGDEEDIGNAFLQLAPFLKAYASYAKNYQQAISLLLEWEGRSNKFRTWLQNTESRPEVNKKLAALLITPIQRVPRYRLLLGQLLKYTQRDNKYYNNIQRAVNEIEDVAEHIDTSLVRAESVQRTLMIQRALKQQQPHIIAPGRHLVKEGVLHKVLRHGNNSQPRLFFLFTDVLLYTKLPMPTFTPQPSSKSEGELLESEYKAGSLECCCMLPLRHCSVLPVLGSGTTGLFRVKCDGEDMLLYSTDEYSSGREWVQVLQAAVKSAVDKRKTLRKDSSSRKPVRRPALRKFTIKEEPNTLTPLKATKQGLENDEIKEENKEGREEVQLRKKSKLETAFNRLSQSPKFGGTLPKSKSKSKLRDFPKLELGDFSKTEGGTLSKSKSKSKLVGTLPKPKPQKSEKVTLRSSKSKTATLPTTKRTSKLEEIFKRSSHSPKLENSQKDYSASPKIVIDSNHSSKLKNGFPNVDSNSKSKRNNDCVVLRSPKLENTPQRKSKLEEIFKRNSKSPNSLLHQFLNVQDCWISPKKRREEREREQREMNEEEARNGEKKGEETGGEIEGKKGEKRKGEREEEERERRKKLKGKENIQENSKEDTEILQNGTEISQNGTEILQKDTEISQKASEIPDTFETIAQRNTKQLQNRAKILSYMEEDETILPQKIIKTPQKDAETAQKDMNLQQKATKLSQKYTDEIQKGRDRPQTSQKYTDEIQKGRDGPQTSQKYTDEIQKGRDKPQKGTELSQKYSDDIQKGRERPHTSQKATELSQKYKDEIQKGRDKPQKVIKPQESSVERRMTLRNRMLHNDEEFNCIEMPQEMSRVSESTVERTMTLREKHRMEQDNIEVTRPTNEENILRRRKTLRDMRLKDGGVELRAYSGTRARRPLSHTSTVTYGTKPQINNGRPFSYVARGSQRFKITTSPLAL